MYGTVLSHFFSKGIANDITVSGTKINFKVMINIQKHEEKIGGP
jgi:hypothetical protein